MEMDRGDRRAAWSESELEQFEHRLLDERKEAVAQLTQLDDQVRRSIDDETDVWRFHMADEGTDTMEKEQASLLASREGRLLWNIDQGLRRLYREPEMFGRCDDCGRVIARARLDAIPYARYCVDCKKDWEGDRPG